MAAETQIYTRLTRNSAGVGTYSSLWLASDHLLIVSSTGFSETYARIMLADVKAFFVTNTSRQLWWACGWGLIALVSGIRVVLLLSYHRPPVGSAIFLGLATIGLVINWMRGAGCRVQVMTGVQNTVLPSLIRIKKTRAVLARLEPLIVAAQANRVTRSTEPIAGSATADRTPPTRTEAPGLAVPAQPTAVPPSDSATPS